MKISSRFFVVFGSVGLFAAAHAGNILVNPGFETGDLTGWTTSGFTIDNTNPHSGTFDAFSNGNVFIEQDFAAVADTSITEISYWIMQPNIGSNLFQAVDFLYSDSSTDEFVPGGANSTVWQQANVTSHLDLTKSLVGIRLWGYSANGQTDFTSYDDVVVNVNPSPEPASMVALGLGTLAIIRKRRARKA